MSMHKFLKWAYLVLIGNGLLAACFVWLYAPIRARRLSGTYEQFRKDFHAQHERIDAQFRQHDRMVDGLQWHYVDEGNPSGTAVLFLHGLPESWYSWSKVLPLVDHDYRLIAIDMKGYGRSDKQDRDYNWHTVASQTLNLMTSLGINTFYVVAHDWGSLIGSVLVSDYSDRILGFVRMEADLGQKGKRGRVAAYVQKPQWLLFQNQCFATALMQDSGWFIDMVYRRRMTTPFQRADRDYLVYEFSRPGVAEVLPKYFERRNWDLDTALGNICTDTFPFPVLQLQADSDPAQPPSLFADISTKCPHVQMEWIKQACHFDNFDQPGQVADAINRFLHASGR
jgi:epoxide hydrolase 4